ncbi:MAG: L-aspartate oxidase [Gammaproteobacteria bacterium]|nr:L-aspartate oxidase [Gammaproteobacteria bacterium]MDH5261291.1 L-aspartate oxidase [Gammaproteobacteria bacterium]
MSKVIRRAKDNADVIVVGSGLAGLACALALAPKPVTVITKTPTLAGGSSLWAQGGIAAAIGPGDSPEQHALDTLLAGAGLCEPEPVRELTRDSATNLQWLLELGAPFDRVADGTVALAKEAAHRLPRVVHAGGDSTGLYLMRTLIDRVARTPSIKVMSDTFAGDLLVNREQIEGLTAYSAKSGWITLRSSNVVLATGGIGACWMHTTNPLDACGDGLAIAARAGAVLADLEFMQFHPTALAIENKGASLPLLTEALRGAGALLLDESGSRFMQHEHAAAELAPRDVVARAIHQRTIAGQHVYLDLRPVFAAGLDGSFPQAMAVARKAGFDPRREPLPVVAAAHYHMGGIRTDSKGRTSLPGLWACGEVATTGVHGANRLASNSLLEALTYARRVADDIRHSPMLTEAALASTPMLSALPRDADRRDIETVVLETRALMSKHVGIQRSGEGLQTAASRLLELERKLTSSSRPSDSERLREQDLVRLWGETRNRLLVARLVTHAALRREESRGAHCRSDFPAARPEWQHRKALTVAELAEAH